MQIPWYVGVSCMLVVGYGLLYWQAQRAPYFPLKYPQGFWDVQRELGAEDTWIKTRDGVRLHGWWIGVPESPFVTLYLHGNAGNVTYRFPQMHEIPTAGSSMLMLDYRGYGKSEGSPSEVGLYRDADAAYESLLARGYHPSQIIVQGESLGTAVAIDLASRRECRGLVLESAFSSGRDVAGMAFPIVGPLLFRGFDSKSKISKVHVPVLSFHGQRDDIVPVAMARTLFDAAPEPKRFFEVPGAGHNDLLTTAGPEYRRRLVEFYAMLSASH